MRYRALACDYDGTIAYDGGVSTATIQALEQLRKSGRRLILVTGRELSDLAEVFSRLDLFDWIVAENGAVLYRPTTREGRMLAKRPPEEFVRELIRRGVQCIATGRVIVATKRPYESIVAEVIRDFELELDIILNKGSVMILPAGVDKATGLTTVLHEIGLSRHNVVGVGDAENDEAFLAICERSVAVANALDSLKQYVDWVTEESNGAGVIELVQALISTDLAHLDDRSNQTIG